MDDLVAFLRARLDEDEAKADGLFFACRDPARRPDFQFAGGPAAEDFWRHYDPARVLREVAAKRAILDLHKIYSEPEVLNIDHIDKKWNTGWVEHKETGRTVYWCQICDDDRDYGHIATRQEGCETLRLLAAVYSGHPDYRPEWKP